MSTGGAGWPHRDHWRARVFFQPSPVIHCRALTCSVAAAIAKQPSMLAMLLLNVALPPNLSVHVNVSIDALCACRRMVRHTIRCSACLSARAADFGCLHHHVPSLSAAHRAATDPLRFGTLGPYLTHADPGPSHQGSRRRFNEQPLPSELLPITCVPCCLKDKTTTFLSAPRGTS